MSKLSDLHWFIGLFEGEGTFNITSTRKRKAISITSTDLDVLERVQRVIGGGNIVPSKPRNVKWKDCWVWTLRSSEAVPVIRKMLPHLSARRRARAEEFLSIDREVREIAAKKSSKISARNRLVKKMGEKGKLHREIAEELGIDRSYVTQIIGGRFD